MTDLIRFSVIASTLPEADQLINSKLSNLIDRTYVAEWFVTYEAEEVIASVFRFDVTVEVVA